MKTATTTATTGALATGALRCCICGHSARSAEPADLGAVRGNTARFIDRVFPLWRCPSCKSIHSLDAVDYADIYSDYPGLSRQLDAFARLSYANLLRRLRRAGLTRNASILDHGCGSGVFVSFLRAAGYRDVQGYDPFVEAFAARPDRRFDCVIANDVIEHVTDPAALIADCSSWLQPDGVLYIGTADAEPVDMARLETERVRLHQPFHRVIMTEASLHRLSREAGFRIERAYRRSYMDRLVPFSNYRFIDEFNRAHGYDMDRALAPEGAAIVSKRPMLLWWAFFGYFLPSAFEPAVVLRRAVRSDLR